MADQPPKPPSGASSRSDFEKRGGYTTPAKSMPALPKASPGPAPGGAAKPTGSVPKGQSNK